MRYFFIWTKTKFRAGRLALTMEGKLSLSFYRGRPKTWSIFPTVSIYQVPADVQAYSVTCLCCWWLGRLVRMSDRLWTTCSRAISNFERRIFKLERTSSICWSLWIQSVSFDLRWYRWKCHWTSWLLLNETTYGIRQNIIERSRWISDLFVHRNKSN